MAIIVMDSDCILDYSELVSMCNIFYPCYISCES